MLVGLNFAMAYLDDILIKSENLEEHKNHVREVFKRIQEYGFKLGPEKCEFCMIYLGQIIDHEGSKKEFHHIPQTDFRDVCGINYNFKMEYISSQKISHTLSRLISKSSEPLEEMLIASLKEEKELSEILVNIIRVTGDTRRHKESGENGWVYYRYEKTS